MADLTSASVDIAAEPDRVMRVIADFEAYPEWVASLKTAEVLSRSAGRAETVPKSHASIKWRKSLSSNFAVF